MTKDIHSHLRIHGQEHLIPFLLADSTGNLASQLHEIDWPLLERALDECVFKGSGAALPEEYGPAPYYPADPADEAQAALYAQARSRGKEVLSAGRVAAFTVAGGQGTRLGYDGPKGTLPVSPIANRTLFEIFALKIRAARTRYRANMPWLIMCSPLNIEQTRSFFVEHHWFDLGCDTVVLFAQGTMPAIDFNGRLLLETPSGLALSPDGHGGSIKALIASGAARELKRLGVDHISYFQVDNPLVEPADPLFLGLHDLMGSDMSSRSLTKTGPFEKLGNFVLAGDRLTIIEYSDLPAERATEKEADGKLTFRAGSPAIHLIRRDFIESFATSGGLSLPFHRAEKTIPHVNAAALPIDGIDGESGKEVFRSRVVPDKPNGIKFETFVFDALPMARNPVILETRRADQFSPVKNRTGVDSLESCRADMLARDASWVRSAGFTIPRDCRVEISPLAASCPDDLLRYADGLEWLREGGDYLIEPDGINEK